MIAKKGVLREATRIHGQEDQQSKTRQSPRFLAPLFKIKGAESIAFFFRTHYSTIRYRIYHWPIALVYRALYRTYRIGMDSLGEIIPTCRTGRRHDRKTTRRKGNLYRRFRKKCSIKYVLYLYLHATVRR